MRLVHLIALAPVIGLAVAPYPAPPSAASCAAPYLTEAEHLVFERGTPTTVEGEAFVDGCQDVGSCTVGCGASCDYGPEPAPMKDVGLLLRQRGHDWPLGTADADAEGRVTWTIEHLPRGAVPGKAKLVVESVDSVIIRIR